MRNKKLSFIVPVYKVAPYICKCVDSLLEQDYDDYEIILVDDGSPDECPQICDTYADIYDNIRVIHKENGGLSSARNTGILAAKGEYVCFLDSDDYWQPNQLGMLMEQIEQEQLEVLRFNHQNVKMSAEGQYDVFQPTKAPHHVDKRHEVVDGETYLDERMGYACYACQFIIKRSLLVNSDACLFMEGIHFEDVEWLPRMMLNAKRVNGTDRVVYSYLQRPGSITQTEGDTEKIRKNLEDRIIVISSLTNQLAVQPNSSWIRNMQSSMSAGVLTTIARDFYVERKEYIKRLSELKVFPLKIVDQGRTYARRARMINIIGANAYCMIMHMISEK